MHVVADLELLASQEGVVAGIFVPLSVDRKDTGKNELL